MKSAKLWSRNSAGAATPPTMPESASSRRSLKSSLKRSRKRDPANARREFLALRPRRNPILEWLEEEGHVVLHVKLNHTWKTRLLNIFFQVPRERRVVLDAIGSDVWQMLDGQNTIGHIAKAVAGKYKLNAREAELSLQQFFKDLGRRGYIGFMIEAEPATAND
ncbi:MAG TPA: PqqD family protein [Abditibacteriaceae bacterium]|nr:PqqD family protein [Abditibacteriaceae bacterium]